MLVSFVTFASVKGAPGVTTLSLLAACELARRLPGAEGRIVLAECDPSGGDLAPRLGLRGVPGLATLALAARGGLDTELLAAHSQAVPDAEGVRLLAGTAGPEQGRALAWLVEELAELFAAASGPAVVDLGRVRLGDPLTLGLNRAARASLLVSRCDTAAVLHLRSAIESVRKLGLSPSLVAVGNHPYAPEEVAAAAGCDLAGWLPEDAVAIAALGPSARAKRDARSGGGSPAAGPRRDHSASPARRRHRVARDQLAALVDGLGPLLGLSPPPRAWAWSRKAAM